MLVRAFVSYWQATLVPIDQHHVYKSRCEVLPNRVLVTQTQNQQHRINWAMTTFVQKPTPFQGRLSTRANYLAYIRLFNHRATLADGITEFEAVCARLRLVQNGPYIDGWPYARLRGTHICTLTPSSIQGCAHTRQDSSTTFSMGLLTTVDLSHSNFGAVGLVVAVALIVRSAVRK